MARRGVLACVVLTMACGVLLVAWGLGEQQLAGAGEKQVQLKSIGSTKQLMVDGWLIAKRRNVELRLHSPERKEVVFRFDQPWEGKQSGYMTVLQDGETFRLYYRGGGDRSREYTCVAESKDGIEWVRPELGLYEVNGSKENNVIWTGREKSYYESHNFAPFIDKNPAALASQRYKAVGLGRHYDEQGERKKALVVLTSPDGIHWKRLQEEGVITGGSFDSLNTVFWDVVEKRYVCYLRIGREGKRSIACCSSEDFIHWTKPEPLDFGNAPLEHLYTNGLVQYAREPHFYLGFPMRFVPERTLVGGEKRKTDGVSDAVFMSSRDGIHWNRFMEAFIRPGLNPHNWGEAHGNNTPAWGLLQTAESELSLYWGENYEATPRLRRGTVRVDGFVSVNAPHEGGELVTHPLQFEGSKLVVNYATSAVGSIRVEVQDIKGKAIPGFGLGACDEVYGDEISRMVSWNEKTDVGELSGKPVRLRVVMKDADLFSLQFQE